MNAIKTHFSDCKYIYACIILTVIIAAAAGSVYEARLSDDMRAGVLETVAAAGGFDGWDIFRRACINNGILLGVLFLGGFFKLGAVADLAVMARFAFSAGFSSAAFVDAYGVKGLLLSSAGVFSGGVQWAAAVFFAAVSVRMALRGKNERCELLLSYFFLSIFTAAIFCVAAALKGSATTIFMNKILEFLKNAS